MRGSRNPWTGLWVVLLIWLMSSSSALAAVDVEAPVGWSEAGDAAPQAQRRAARWASALELRMTQVLSPSDTRKTIAVFERSTPVTASEFEDEALARDTLAHLVEPVVGPSEPKETGLRKTATGQEMIWARWELDNFTYECALAPSRDTSSLIISVDGSNNNDSRVFFEGVLYRLEGVSEPMPAFSVWLWRLGAPLLWIFLAFGLHRVLLAIGDRHDDHGEAGRRASITLLILTSLAAAAAWFLLNGRGLALGYAGTSQTSMAVWVGVCGAMVACGHWVLSHRMDRGKVQSAPASGVYASGTYSSAGLSRSSVIPRNYGNSATPNESSGNYGASASGSYSASGSGSYSSSSGSFANGKLDEPAATASASARIVIDESEREFY